MRGSASRVVRDALRAGAGRTGGTRRPSRSASTRLAVGLATLTFVVGTFAAPRAEAHPEACVAVYPVACSYEAHHLVGCVFMGHVVIYVDGTKVLDATADTPQEGFDACTDIAPGEVEVVPQTPGTWAIVGNDNLEVHDVPDPNARSVVNPSLLRHARPLTGPPGIVHQLLAHTQPGSLDPGTEE